MPEKKESALEHLYPLKLSGKVEFINRNGETIVKTRYTDSLEQFSEGLLAICLDEKWGFIDSRGNEVAELQFEDAEYFSEGKAPVILNGKLCYINTSGEIITQTDFGTGPFGLGLHKAKYSEGFAVVKVDSKYAYIDNTQKLAFGTVFDWAFPFSNGYAIIKKEKEKNSFEGILKTDGSLLIEPVEFVGLRYPAEGLIPFVKEELGKWGYIDYDQNIIIPPQFGKAYGFENGQAIVSIKEYHLWAIIDSNGKILKKLKCDELSGFSEGLALFSSNRLHGYYDREFNTVIAARFNSSYDFHKGLAYVTEGAYHGYIDKQGEYIRKERNGMPVSMEEAVQAVIQGLSQEDIETVKETKFEDLIQFHSGWGMGIRNEFGMWNGNVNLLESCGNRDMDPDEASMVIIEAVWKKLRG